MGTSGGSDKADLEGFKSQQRPLTDTKAWLPPIKRILLKERLENFVVSTFAF